MKMRKAIGGLSLLVGAVLLLGSGGAYAAETAAGTTVTNSVSLDFQVNGTAQTQQTASVDFKVDDKLAIGVQNSDSAIVTTNTQPGSTTAATKYTVTNNGNKAQGVVLNAAGMASGTASTYGTSNLDMSGVTTGVYSDAACTTSITQIDSLAPGASQNVYVCATIPSSATNNQIAVVGLKAQVGDAVASGATVTAITTDDSGTDKNTNSASLNTEMNIFADAATTHHVTGDGAYDGTSSDLGAYQIQAASLSINKAVTVLKDPLNSSTPHAIPGATLEYTVTIDNATGAQSATSLDVKDTIPSNLTYTASSIKVQLPGASAPGAACADSSGSVTQGTAPNTNTATCNFNSSTKQIEVNGFNVGAGQTVIITYDATIN